MRNVTPKEKQKNPEFETDTEHDVTIKPQSEKEASIGMLAHLLVLLGWFGLPLVNLVAPLVVWFVCKDKHPFAVDQAKESLNFQITISIALLISLALVPIGIGKIGLVILPLVNLFLVFKASFKANKGIAYRYPCTIRLIS